MPEPALDPVDVRVLGCLVEKAALTPDQYPLSLNALVAAANQRSSREPVMDLDEARVAASLERLRAVGLVFRTDLAGSRVARFRHRLEDAWHLPPDELAVLSVLFLRGAQTAAQIRARTERQHLFRDGSEVVAALDALAAHAADPGPLARRLERAPGEREARYTHAWDDAPAPAEREVPFVPAPAAPPESSPPSPDRLAELESRVARLEADLAALRAALGEGG